MSKPLHPKASGLQRAGLFAGLKSFDGLETRIAALPDERARGDAFEVFAEAYLATQRKHDAAHVWPHGSVPLDILKNLGLTQQDQGVDGVLQTLLGQFNAYQVKFRTGRPSLTWRELSTFIGLADSPRIHSRVLLTNCDELPAVLNDRQGFFCIRGADLDRMEADDFRAIEAWLADAAYAAPKKTPQEHQTEALDALLPALQTHDRVSAIMACGTGKTLVALWVTERLEARRVLVLLPSLALLRQTLHEWLRETSLPSLAYLCVCSDPTVKEGIDALTTQQSDLDFQVSTDAATVRSFLDAPFAGVKMIFSTYQSASVVGAAMKPGETFDLAVFDEAHKTAGREGRNFAFALEDKNLCIRKRLFLTATPRHYNPQRKDKEGDAQLVFSMDKPRVYGEQAFRLTFAEAARRGIICNYKVVISVITSGMVTNELLSRGEVLVNGDLIRARQVANQLALTDAIAKYGVNKVFTFHRTVKSAESFVAAGSEGIGTHLLNVGDDVRSLTSNSTQHSTVNPQPISQSLVTSSATNEFQTFHVNGTMPTAHRERVMRDFREASRAVISNARCLTEGVDVPAVDMVAFLSPRRSLVDIVQATGRAMRRSPGKKTGYVLVPLYLEQAAGEAIEDAVNRAEFDEVWDVLQSLQEQDDVLAEIIRAMREQRGKTRGFNDAEFQRRVEICGPSFSLTAIRNAITTECIDRLGASWDERFGELGAFKECFGHCQVPVDWPDNPRLGSWVGSQRQLKKCGRLSKRQIHVLNALGFVWDRFRSAWEDMFAKLVDYKRKHGNTNVPDGLSSDKPFSKWVAVQRSARNAGTLTDERIRRLEQIGFSWHPLGTAWDKMYSALKQFHKKHGHCNIPSCSGKDRQLGTWVTVQRSAREVGRISNERIARLEHIGFVWNPLGAAWEEMFAALQDYQRTHGDCNVSSNWSANPRLGKWVIKQRSLRKQGALAESRFRRLDAISFNWDTRDSSWEAMYAALKNYKLKYGTCKIPQGWRKNSSLAAWVARQRQHARTGNLSPDRIKRLERVGFIWNPFEAAWEEMFLALVKFQRKQGHCNVSREEDSELSGWVVHQRARKKSNRLQADYIRRLEKIGFTWNTLEAAWEEKFSVLLQFWKKHGHCNVPRGWAKNLQLENWIANQRAFKKKGKLSRERIRRLNSIGFLWKVK